MNQPSDQATDNTFADSSQTATSKTRRHDLAVIGFGLLLSVFALSGIFGYISSQRLEHNRIWVTHTHEVIQALESFHSSLKDAETGQRGFLLTEDKTYLEPYESALRDLPGQIRHLNDLTTDNRIQQGRLAELDSKLEARLDQLKVTIELMSAGDRLGALKVISSNAGKQLMDEIRRDVLSMRQAEEELLKKRALDSQAAYRTTILSIILPAMVGIALVGIVFMLTQRNALQRQRAAERLANQKEQLRITLASIGDAVISTDARANVVFLNPIAETATGWTQQEARGKPLGSVFHIVNESTRNEVENPALRALSEGIIVGLANHTVLIRKDGTEVPIDDSAAPIRDSRGNVTGAVLVFRDISERKREEAAQIERARLVLLRADVSAALASVDATSLCLKQCCDAFVSYLGGALVEIWTADGPEQTVELQSRCGMSPLGGFSDHDGQTGESTITRIIESGQPLVSNSISHESASNNQHTSSDGANSFAGFPLPVEGRVAGVVTALSQASFHPDFLTELIPLSKAIAQFIDRRHAEERLQEQAELHRTTLVSIGDAVITTDVHGRITHLNLVAESLTAWTDDEARGLPLDTVFQIINETTHEPVESPAVRALREGIIVGLANHTVLITRNGRELPIDDSAAPIRRKNGEIAGCVLVFRDVSQRRHDEELLREDQERLDFALASADLGLWDLSLKDHTAHRTLRHDQIFGYDSLQPIWTYEKLLEHIVPEDRSIVESRFQESIANRTPFDFECRIRSADGSERWIWSKARIQIGRQGRLERMVGIIGDITVRKRIEADRQRLVLLAEHSTDFIGMYDPDGTPLYVNRAGLEMVGLKSMQQASQTTLQDFFFPEDQQQMLETFIPSVLETGHGEIEIRLKHFVTGDNLWVLFRAFVLTDPTHQKIGLATVSRDITQRRQLEDHLRSLTADLSEINRRKDEFLATLAHELRNPLAPIRNGLQLMQLAAGEAEAVAQARTMMERQLTQLVRLVDDLMDVSRISRGKIELRMERLQLSAVINSAVETSRPLIEEMGHSLTVTLPDEPIEIEGDLTRLAQVFMNLLNNAAKYTDRNGRIWLTTDRQGPNVIVTVGDNGIGIAANELTRIFEMFSQVDRSLEKSQGGLGIGLTLVKRLVEMHQGSIVATSEGTGKGSTFTVTLPIAADSVTSAEREGQESKLATAMLRILIVDDNRDGADSLALMLSVIGNTTRTAYDGEEAVRVAEEFQPQVILLDIGLPKLNGYEACRRIRQSPVGKDAMIIAQTGWGQEEDRRRTHEAGFDYHLVKPVDPNILMDLLAKRSSTAKSE